MGHWWQCQCKGLRHFSSANRWRHWYRYCCRLPSSLALLNDQKDNQWTSVRPAYTLIRNRHYAYDTVFFLVYSVRFWQNPAYVVLVCWIGMLNSHTVSPTENVRLELTPVTPLLCCRSYPFSVFDTGVWVTGHGKSRRLCRATATDEPENGGSSIYTCCTVSVEPAADWTEKNKINICFSPRTENVSFQPYMWSAQYKNLC